MKETKSIKNSKGCGIAVVLSAILTGLCAGDTFKNKSSGQIYHGFATQDVIADKTVVFTQESGKLELNLSQYKISPDSAGRNPVVPVISVNSPIEYEIVTSAFEKTIIDESNKGPLFIIIEIDSPGGRVDLAMRMCSSLSKTTNCQTIAFLKGGPHGGAYSAAAALSLACNKIYMSGGTAIGAATVIASSSEGDLVELETAVGKNISEKMRSAWRNYMASLAEQNHRPAAIVRAMENKDIEVLQVKRGGKTAFIESTEKLPDDQIIRTRNRRGTILTLPAGEAVECGIADKVVSSLQDIMAENNASEAKIEHPDQLIRAKDELDKVIRKFKQLNNSLDTKFKAISAKNKAGGMTLPEAKKAMKSIMQEIKYLIKLKQNYPDVPCEQEDLQAFLNSVQAEYDSL